MTQLSLEVRETGPGTVRDLTADQVAGLLSVPGLLRLTPAAGGRWRLTGNQKVGLIRLRTPAGETIRLHLRPKLAVHDLLFLLTYSPTDPWHPDDVTAAASNDLLPALTELLARTARRTLDAGVLHGYRTVEEELPLLRGRIRTADQLRRVGMPLPVAVRYDDHTPDIAENRILLAALHLAARLPGVPVPTTLTLRHLADHLSGVQPLPPGAPLPRWTPTRLNSRYRHALRLAELLLSARSVRPDGEATVTVDGFLLDMPKVFERFLEDTLRAALSPRASDAPPRRATTASTRPGRCASGRTWCCTAPAARSRSWTRSTPTSTPRPARSTCSNCSPTARHSASTRATWCTRPHPRTPRAPPPTTPSAEPASRSRPTPSTWPNPPRTSSARSRSWRHE